MVARGLKNLYFAHLRSAPPVDDESLRKCTAAFLNDAFADDEAATTFWREKLLPKLQVDFEYASLCYAIPYANVVCHRRRRHQRSVPLSIWMVCFPDCNLWSRAPSRIR